MVQRLVMEALCLFLLQAIIISADRKNGDYIIGAILGIRKTENGTCRQVNYEGLAVSEAIRFAVSEINNDHKLLGKLTIASKLGYDIRDNCGSIEKEKDIAYAFNDAIRKSRETPTAKKPVSAVIGKFSKESASVMQLLKFEKIPQLSWDPENVNLQKVGMSNDQSSDLLSTYPADQSKSNVVAGIVKEFKFEFTSIIVKNNARGRAWLAKLEEGLNKSEICFSSNKLVNTEDDIKKAIRKVSMNTQVKVVAIYGEQSDELVAIKEAKRLNLTNIIFLSSNYWKKKLDEMRPFASQVEGMISVASDEPDAQGFKRYMEDDSKPLLTDNALLQQVLLKMGASVNCAKKNARMSAIEKDKCNEAKMQVRNEILKYKEQIAYTIDAVYVFANGLQKTLTAKNKPSSSLLDAMKSLDFESPVTKNKIKINKDRNMIAQSFSLYNFQGNVSSMLRNIKVGQWQRDNEKRLVINKAALRWKDASKKAPVSKCSRDCMMGEAIEYPTNAPLCCWLCVPCPNLTFSNTSNSKCSKCPLMQTPNPQKTKCFLFKQQHLSISNPLAEFAMFLMVIGLLFTFLAMFLLNQNKECKVMKIADNETIQTLLLGVLIILLSAIPLLFKPTINMCMVYASTLNIGLTISLAALITKTWLIHSSFYNEDGTFKPTCFSSRPGFCIGLIILLLQVALLVAGMYLEKVYIAYDDTEQWNMKYIECSLFREYVFWISYGYNIGLSILINFFNCGVPNVEARFGEYNWLCLTACTYYIVPFLFITTFFAFDLLVKVEVGIVITVLHAFVFLLAYILPKLHKVLFMPEDKMKELGRQEKLEKAPLMFIDDDDEALMQMVAHAGGGDVFKRNIVQVKIQQETDEESET